VGFCMLQVLLARRCTWSSDRHGLSWCLATWHGHLSDGAHLPVMQLCLRVALCIACTRAQQHLLSPGTKTLVCFIGCRRMRCAHVSELLLCNSDCMYMCGCHQPPCHFMDAHATLICRGFLKCYPHIQWMHQLGPSLIFVPAIMCSDPARMVSVGFWAEVLGHLSIAWVQQLCVCGLCDAHIKDVHDASHSQHHC